MDFKIGTVSKMTGLSPSGIRFLEDQGLLSPSGGRKGSYRSYTLSDVSKLLDYRNYRKCGISQEDILKLISDARDFSGKEVFENRCDELEEDILEATRLLHFLRRRGKDIEHANQADTFWEISWRPAIIWMSLETVKGRYAEWPDSTGFEIPYTDSTLLFDSDRIIGASGEAESELGIGMLESDVLKTGFLGLKGVRYFESHAALHCIVEITDSFEISGPSRLRTSAFFREAAEQRGLTTVPGHPAISRRIITGKRDGRDIRYDDFWLDAAFEKK